MPVRSWIIAGWISSTLASATAARSEDMQPTASTSYDRDVQPIVRKRCASCHNAERPRGELDLTSYAGVLSGGAGGKAVVARAPEESPAYTMAAHLEEPHMPPNAARIPQRELDVLRRWIEGGLVEHAGDAGSKPTSGAGTDHPATPAGGLVPPVASARAGAVTALAVGPTRPIAVVSGHKQVLVLDIAERKTLGALPFPEGNVFALRFSVDGKTLLAAGGLGAESGHVVLFDTRSWRRIATLGDEFDAILAADLSPDGARVVFGGPSRIVKLIGSPRGDVLQTFRKPADWVTAASFSPDGLLVAAGDRFGGLYLWEARSGKEYLSLRGHAKAVTAIAWLADRDAMVTAGEDGRIEVWDLHTGTATAGWDAHPGGVLGLDVHRSGRIASAGRDRRIKAWGTGAALVSDLGPTADQSTRVGWTPDGHTIVSGDCAGEIRIWNLDGSSYASLPTPVAPKSPVLAQIVPDLSPARPYVRKPTATPPVGRRAVDPPATGDDLDAALASARAAAAAAEKTVADLSRIARSRSRAKESPEREESTPSSVLEALKAADAGLTSLRAALAADPTNTALAHAVEETRRAVHLLEQKRDRTRSGSARP